MLRSLVGSEMCIRDSINAEYGGLQRPMSMFKKKTPFQRGMAAIKDRKYGLAKKELIQATSETNNPEASDKLGLLFFREGDFDNAQHNFEQALAMDGHFGDAMHHMAVLFYNTDRRDEAVGLCEEAVENLPDHALVRLNFGSMLYNNQAYGPAIKMMEEALQMNPDSPECRLRLETAMDRHGALSYEAGVDTTSNKSQTVLPKPKQSGMESFIKFLGVGCKNQMVQRNEQWSEFEPVVNMEGLEDHYSDVIPDFKNL
eukprot:TRINITY_DN15926_c0_g1_i4.p1 TRINITY_DN15926_c0_g1~~TRINITY_DN15926_c0_g1_i4.p1  ORF type:complete len:257 (-),score=89.65 TRINITY_DN15926_c0_g1_i4:482-1252(-)